MHYFREELTGCASWEQVFQCMDAWAPLIRHIFMRENLPFTAMAHMTEGTNVVFRVGDYVAKVFAPPASGFDTGVDYDAEVFGLRLAQSHGICAPKCIATGRVCDKYDFDYIIMDYVPGQDLHFAHAQLTEQEKFNIGQQLRAFSDKLNRPCEEFRPIHARRNWSRARQFTMCPPSFQAERAAYLATHQFSEDVFVHADLSNDNVLITPNKDICVIDFADAQLAPRSYDTALIVCEVFQFDHAYLRGFFGTWNTEELTEICLEGVLIHQFGGSFAREYFVTPEELASVAQLRNEIRKRLT